MLSQSAFMIELHIVEDNSSIWIDYYLVAAESVAVESVATAAESTATTAVSTVVAAESVVASVEAPPHAVKAAIAKIANTFFIRMSLMFK
jgi:hypothetical protein